MNLRQMAEAAGFWGHYTWAAELKEFALLVAQQAQSGDVFTHELLHDHSLTDESPPPTL